MEDNYTGDSDLRFVKRKDKKIHTKYALEIRYARIHILLEQGMAPGPIANFLGVDRLDVLKVKKHGLACFTHVPQNVITMLRQEETAKAVIAKSMILDALADPEFMKEKLQKANLLQIVSAYDHLNKNDRLERGEATSIYQTLNDAEIDERIQRLRREIAMEAGLRLDGATEGEIVEAEADDDEAGCAMSE